jgi:hypothetical protein
VQPFLVKLIVEVEAAFLNVLGRHRFRCLATMASSVVV